jgi:hypothetical protein
MKLKARALRVGKTTRGSKEPRKNVINTGNRSDVRALAFQQRHFLWSKWSWQERQNIRPSLYNSISFTGAHTNKNMKRKLERPTSDTEKNSTITVHGKKENVTKKSKSNGDSLGDEMKDWPEYFHSVSS